MEYVNLGKTGLKVSRLRWVDMNISGMTQPWL